jgi:Ca-activated chloride channel family protein
MRRVKSCVATLLAATMGLGFAACGKPSRSKQDQAESVSYLSQADQEVLPDAQQFNTEEYGKTEENEFLEVASHPVSTFSIDTDTASYTNVRRFIAGGSLPPRNAVRIEELINYFKYDYPQPQSEQPFSITNEVAGCPWQPSHKLVHVGIKGKEISFDNAPPSNLVFLIDTSGSMNSPDKLPLLKESLRMLVSQLRPQDQVAIVAYAGSAGLVLSPTRGSNKASILSSIDQLESGGSTAGGAGIKLAYTIARQNFDPAANNRVILATDGDFNVGVSSDGELVRLIEQQRESGVFLTVLGFGTGNLKDSKMELLADKGNGNYAYIDRLGEARRVLIGELSGTLNTIAKDVKIQIEFNPARVKGYRLLGYENRLLRSEEFNDDQKDAGELGAGHTVTALYEIVPPGSPMDAARSSRLKYQTTSRTAASETDELMTVKLRYKEPQEDESSLLTATLPDADVDMDSGSHNVRFAAAVAAYGMLLKDSKFKGGATYDLCLALARESASRYENQSRNEFVALIEQSRNLSQRQEQAKAY